MKTGDKIRIISMAGEPQYTGKTGIIEFIDDIGQIHGTWGGCALIPGEDDYIIEPARTCPRCGKTYYEYPALSRKDNKTEICPACGMREAIEAFEKEKGEENGL